MLIAGLTGGLATGKSSVASVLGELGCYTVEADALGHEVMMPGAAAYAPIIESFGPAVVRPDGAIDRSRLAGIVFSDEAQLARLNAIVHPLVHNLAWQRFREIEAKEPHAIAIYVAAILIETGGYRQFPKLIVASCTREQQIARALARPGATEADVLRRLDRQMPMEQKKQFADYIIDTSGTVEETRRQTKIVFEDLRKKA